MKTIACVAFGLCFVTPAATEVSSVNQKSARLEIHYAPEENLERIDVGLIDGAKTSIDMAAYVLTDVAIASALERAAARGVKVRIFLEPKQERGAKSAVADFDKDGRTGQARRATYSDERRAKLLATPGVETRRSKRGPWMHLKSYLVDGRLLRMGAANFSASGLKQQDNDLLITDDATLVKRFQSHFEGMWRR